MEGFIEEGTNVEGVSVGFSDGCTEGSDTGTLEGFIEEGTNVVLDVGVSVGLMDGCTEGSDTGALDCNVEGSNVGLLFGSVEITPNN